MGNDELSDPMVRQTVFIVRVIVFALAMGVGTYLTFVLVQGPQGNGANQIAIAGVIFAAIAVVASFFVPRIMHATNRKAIAEGRFVSAQPVANQSDVGRLLQSAQIMVIVACAVLEGAGFFNVFTYSQNGQTYNLVAAGVLIFLILLHFPSTVRWERWLEDELRLIRDMRGK